MLTNAYAAHALALSFSVIHTDSVARSLSLSLTRAHTHAYTTHTYTTHTDE